ncbi:hypothetical protein POM88_033262 [Heracleum sosnowskyi]|uniref:Uncharacterized protein n=1 Tax=Heracleum sosnowskyi TaxID=360622 RepID=A0AAD8I250_9APIA|nr:hypothetical protein POM88_033262 [Heracleum sosnowskyi]
MLFNKSRPLSIYIRRLVIANAVGLALAEKHLAVRFKKPNSKTQVKESFLGKLPCTTLDRGIANVVGLALAEKHLAVRFKKPNSKTQVKESFLGKLPCTTLDMVECYPTNLGH